MKSTGEFFPANISPFGYNETIANDYWPLSEQDATAQGFKWKDPEPPLTPPPNLKKSTANPASKNH